jgi:Regulator of ribonuclease activity B
MNWFTGMLFVAGAFALFRILSHLRRMKSASADDWDARFINQLRKAGVAPFDAHEVDFFFGLPGEAASTQIAQVLRADGFETDGKPDEEGTGWSLHARKSMRLIVPEMQALTLRFRQLAEEQGGKYDGWAVGKGIRK